MDIWSWHFSNDRRDNDRISQEQTGKEQTGKGRVSEPFLTCALLPQPHGFFTSQFYPDTPGELAGMLSPGAEVYRVKQIHSANVLLASEILTNDVLADETLPDRTGEADGASPLPLADGIVTERSNQSVWTCSADCTPALIGDIKTGQVAAVHAGWRGTAQKILPATIARLQDQGSQLKDLRIALGPAISGSQYQVGQDVAAEVGKSIAPHLSDEERIAYLMAVENPPLLSDPAAGKVRLDVRRINQMQLVQMGIEPEQIAIAPHCTYQESDRFFSYRRTKEKKVQWSGIVSQ